MNNSQCRTNEHEHNVNNIIVGFSQENQHHVSDPNKIALNSLPSVHITIVAVKGLSVQTVMIDKHHLTFSVQLLNGEDLWLNLQRTVDKRGGTGKKRYGVTPSRGVTLE